MSILSERVQKWRNKTKTNLIRALGGKCIVCGYNRCHNSLHMHHLDPNEKESTISNFIKNPRAIEKIINEAKKCVLLCANCHGEVHAGLMSIDCNPIFDDSVFEKPKPVSYSCLHCGKPTFNRKFCSRQCIGYSRHKIDWPDPKIVLQMVNESSYVSVGDSLGVSDAAVRKFLKRNMLL